MSPAWAAVVVSTIGVLVMLGINLYMGARSYGALSQLVKDVAARLLVVERVVGLANGTPARFVPTPECTKMHEALKDRVEKAIANGEQAIREGRADRESIKESLASLGGRVVHCETMLERRDA